MFPLYSNFVTRIHTDPFHTIRGHLEDPASVHVVPQPGDGGGSHSPETQHLGPPEPTTTSESVQGLVGELVLTDGDGRLTEDEAQPHRDGGEERSEGEPNDGGPFDEVRGGLTGEEAHGGVLQEATRTTERASTPSSRAREHFLKRPRGLTP